ncbi:hypothetical protein [Catellatospora sichuanensis]|nr:hypothetical protein [Catellatospora sichuanensis]
MAAEEVEKLIAKMAAVEPPAEDGEKDESLIQWTISYTTYRN